MDLSKEFGESAKLELFTKPTGIVQNPNEGVRIVDLEAQNLVADMFYYCLPNLYVFLDLTMPCLHENDGSDEVTDLKIMLTTPNHSNIRDDGLVKDIVKTLHLIYDTDNNANMMFFRPEKESAKDTHLCTIRYDMETFGPAVAKLALKFHPNDENVVMRANFLIHLLERRGGYSSYIPSNKLH